MGATGSASAGGYYRQYAGVLTNTGRASGTQSPNYRLEGLLESVLDYNPAHFMDISQVQKRNAWKC
jgi:hypothetical protein